MTRSMPVQYGSSPAQTADLYLPDTNTLAPVVCLLHGGFWRVPHGRDQFDAIATDLRARGYAVWNIGYRRLGEASGGWPGTMEDVAAAIDHLAALRDQGHRLDLERVAVVGHSAGGQLALTTAARASHPATAITPSRVRPRAVCAQAGLCDLEQAFAMDAGRGAVREFLGGTPEEFPERYRDASPVRRLALEARVLLLHGLDDDAVPVAMSRGYAAAAQTAGSAVELVELPATGHMELLEPSSEAHTRLCEWLERSALQAP